LRAVLALMSSALPSWDICPMKGLAYHEGYVNAL
jgi:hypothetical protein